MIDTIQKYAYRHYGIAGLRPPIFVAGCGHSGTSYLKALFEGHENIFLIKGETNLAFSPFVKGLRTCVIARTETLKSGRHRWLEKTPAHVRRVPQLRAWFPGARFILMLRDGRDVVSSLKARGKSIPDAAHRWKQDARVTWSHRDDTDVYMLRYESLVESGQDEVRRVLDFLEEEPSDLIAAYDERRREVVQPPKIPDPAAEHAKYRQWQVSQPSFDGRARWKNDLKQGDIEMVKGLIERELIEFGYCESMAPP